MTAVSPWLKTDNFELHSRLLVGIEQYSTATEICDVMQEAGAELLIVTTDPKDRASAVAIPDIQAGLDGHPVVEVITTSFASSADAAIATANQIREAWGVRFIKLDVRTDPEQVYPNNIETARAARHLLAAGFEVMPMILPDPYTAHELEDMGCCALRLLAGSIRARTGVEHLELLKQIRGLVGIPCVGEGGIRDVVDAVTLIQCGMDAILVNTAIAQAENPPLAARAMRLAVEAAYTYNQHGRHNGSHAA